MSSVDARDDDDVAALEGAEAGVVHEADDPQRPGPPRAARRCRSVVPDAAPVARRPRCRHERVGRRVRRERDAFGRGSGRRIAESISGSIPSTRSVKTRSSSPGAVETVRRRSADRRRRDDPGQRADRLHRPRAEALVGEGAEADVGPAEEVGGRALAGPARRPIRRRSCSSPRRRRARSRRRPVRCEAGGPASPRQASVPRRIGPTVPGRRAAG